MKAQYTLRTTVVVMAILAFCTVFAASPCWALKNVCPACRTMVKDLASIECPNCARVLNECLACNTRNPVKADFCMGCGAALAESRVLSTIATGTREALRLGQSPRAVQERELAKIENQIAKKGVSAPYAFYRITILTQMEWWSKAAAACHEFLTKWPEDPHKVQVTKQLAEALRRWGYLLYQQGDRKGAIEKFGAAVKTDPANKEASWWFVHTQKGDVEKALTKPGAPKLPKAGKPEPKGAATPAPAAPPADGSTAAKPAKPSKHEKPAKAEPQAKTEPAKAEAPAPANEPAQPAKPVEAGSEVPVTTAPPLPGATGDAGSASASGS